MEREKLRDIDIRKEFIRRNVDFFRATTFVNELGINSKNIVDFAALDFNKNIFYGFEVKSEVDSLKRLPKQLSTYSTFFNIVYVIAHHKHTEHILNFLDANVFTKDMGYIEVSDNLDFKEIRKASFKKPRFDTFIRNLDSEELENLCESKGQYQGWESKSLLVDKIKRSTKIEEIYEHMYNKVKRYYLKNCPKCGSPLYFNKKDRNGHKHSHCFECGTKFD
jgi:hypothetical protein